MRHPDRFVVMFIMVFCVLFSGCGGGGGGGGAAAPAPDPVPGNLFPAVGQSVNFTVLNGTVSGATLRGWHSGELVGEIATDNSGKASFKVPISKLNGFSVTISGGTDLSTGLSFSGQLECDLVADVANNICSPIKHFSDRGLSLSAFGVSNANADYIGTPDLALEKLSNKLWTLRQSAIAVGIATATVDTRIESLNDFSVNAVRSVFAGSRDNALYEQVSREFFQEMDSAVDSSALYAVKKAVYKDNGIIAQMESFQQDSAITADSLLERVSGSALENLVNEVSIGLSEMDIESVENSNEITMSLNLAQVNTANKSLETTFRIIVEDKDSSEEFLWETDITVNNGVIVFPATARFSGLGTPVSKPVVASIVSGVLTMDLATNLQLFAGDYTVRAMFVGLSNEVSRDFVRYEHVLTSTSAAQLRVESGNELIVPISRHIVGVASEGINPLEVVVLDDSLIEFQGITAGIAKFLAKFPGDTQISFASVFQKNGIVSTKVLTRSVQITYGVNEGGEPHPVSPVFGTISNQEVAVGETVSVPLSVENAQEITVSASTFSTITVVGENLEIIGNSAGTETITVSASNDAGTVQQSFQLVVVNPITIHTEDFTVTPSMGDRYYKSSGIRITLNLPDYVGQEIRLEYGNDGNINTMSSSFTAWKVLGTLPAEQPYAFHRTTWSDGGWIRFVIGTSGYVYVWVNPAP